MDKPIQSTEWASDEDSLKLEPTPNLKQFGWSTNDNTENGTPMKPTLNHTNGWKNIVHNWVQYLTGTTDDIIEDVEGVKTRVDVLENPPVTSGTFDIGRAEEFEPKAPKLLSTGERRQQTINRIGVKTSEYFDGTDCLAFGWDHLGANSTDIHPVTFNTSSTSDELCWLNQFQNIHGLIFEYTNRVNEMGLTMKFVCGNGHTWELKPITEGSPMIMDEFLYNRSTRGGDISEAMAMRTASNFHMNTGASTSAYNTYKDKYSIKWFGTHLKFTPLWDFPNNNNDQAVIPNQYNIYKDGQSVTQFTGFGDLDLGNFETQNPNGIRYVAENATIQDGVVTTSKGYKIDTKKGLQRVWYRSPPWMRPLWRDFSNVTDRVYDLNIPIKSNTRYEVDVLKTVVPYASGRGEMKVALGTAKFAPFSVRRPNYGIIRTYVNKPRFDGKMDLFECGTTFERWLFQNKKCQTQAVPDTYFGQPVPNMQYNENPAVDSDCHIFDSITYYPSTRHYNYVNFPETSQGLIKITELD